MKDWPTVPAAPQTFAGFITICAECGAEVSMIQGYGPDEPRLSPCGHVLALRLVPNARLNVPPATPEHE